MEFTQKQNELFSAIMAADRPAANAIIDQSLQEKTPPDQVISNLLDPVLGVLGEMWGKQEISLAQVFVGGKIAEDTLLKCMPSEAVTINKGKVILGNIEDDFHSLGRRLVASYLRASGWDVTDLGNDVTAEEFVDTAIEIGAAVIGVSAMMQTTAMNIKKVRTLIDSRGLSDKIKLAVGGAVFIWSPELVNEVGGDGTATSAYLADALFQRLQNRVKEANP